MSEVAIERVTKVYPGGVKAVDAIDLHIANREFVVLVGPSGCGKSTTLRMVAGLEDITEGTIRIGDRIVNDVAPKDRDIAMVFQNYALYPHMTVYKNMAFGLMMRQQHRGWHHPFARLFAPDKFRQAREERHEIDRNVRATATMLGIDKLLDRRPRALSGGQRQRVAVGRAIVRRPRAFLFDEPLSNLDAKLRVEMRAELKRLHRRLTTTTIYVTHDQEEAMTLGERIVVMKDGLIHQCAGPQEIYRCPANRFVGAFIGTPQMNFLEGRIVAERDDLTFESGRHVLRVHPEHRRLLADHVGRDVILGVRPEAIHPASNGQRSSQIPAVVDVTELMGDRLDVHLSIADGPKLVSRWPADVSIQDGQPINLTVDMAHVHYFEATEDGRNLTQQVR